MENNGSAVNVKFTRDRSNDKKVSFFYHWHYGTYE